MADREDDSREEAEWRWTLTLLSGSVAVAVVLVGSGMHGAAAVLADHQTEPAAVSALFAAAKIGLSFALIPIGAMVMTNAGTMSRSPTCRLGRVRAFAVVGGYCGDHPPR